MRSNAKAVVDNTISSDQLNTGELLTGQLPKLDGSGWVATNYSVLEQRSVNDSNSFLKQLRKKAFECFSKTGLPSKKNEDWKYTDTKRITQEKFSPAHPRPIDIEALKIQLGGIVPSKRVVFVNGVFAQALSTLADSPVTVRSLAEILDARSDRDRDSFLTHFGKHALMAEHPLVAWNTAFLQDGLFLHIPKGEVVRTPIHVIFLSTCDQEHTVSYPRLLIMVEAGGKGAIVEHHVCLRHGCALNVVVSEIVLEEGARLDHYKLQMENKESYHLASTHIRQETRSRYSNFVLSGGGALVRNEIHPVLGGIEADCVLSGLTVADEKQHIDHYTVIDHAAPHCTSDEHFKGIYNNHAVGVFNGTIIVREGAQKTNAFQKNDSLLLSPDAEVNARPQLKIWADDVKCTHGATIGQLDEEALYYLCSRGIDSVAAKRMLVHAFSGVIMNRIGDDSLRSFFQQFVDKRLEASV